MSEAKKKKAGRPRSKKRKKGEERKVYTFTLDPLVPEDKSLMDYLEKHKKITDNVKKGLQLLISGAGAPEGQNLTQEQLQQVETKILQKALSTIQANEQMQIEEQMKAIEKNVIEKVMALVGDSKVVFTEENASAKEEEDQRETFNLLGMKNLKMAKE